MQRWCVLLLLLASTLSAEPRVRQFDPPAEIRLGQPAFWMLEVRHPMWESYSLTLQSPAGAKMAIDSRKDRRVGDSMVSLYRISIVAENLSLASPPAAVITGSAGAAVVSTRALTVVPISGASL